MPNGIINVYLYRESDKLKMRIINIKPWTRIEDNSKGRLQIIYLREKEPDLGYLIGACKAFNNIDRHDPFWQKIEFESDSCDYQTDKGEGQFIDQAIELCLSLPINDAPVYQYQEVVVTLADDNEKELLMLLVALDTAIKSIKPNKVMVNFNNY